MRVLLVSPLPGIDPACGDVIYTQMLLAHPPEGVVYETYSDALQRGVLVEHGRRKRFWREPFLTAACKIVNTTRSRRWLFWEPFRILTVKPGEYDLVHVHVFSCGFRNLDCPLVISNAAPLRFLYTGARGWSEARTALVEKIEVALAKAFGINHVSYTLPQATRLVVFTQYLKEWYITHKIMPADRIDIAPIYLPAPAATPRPNVNPTRVGFIAKDFDAKGGQTLLKAWEIVRRSRPDAGLTIVGSMSRLEAPAAEALDIQWLPHVERSRLLHEILPAWDVFAYPTEFDGLPLVALEAMSLGIPIATSSYQAMPEIVGRAGLVSPVGAAETLAQNILRLLEPEANAQFRSGAAARFREVYSARSVAPRLLDAYRLAQQAFPSVPAAREVGESVKWRI